MANDVDFVLVHGTWAHGFWRAIFWRWIPKRYLPHAVNWPHLCQNLEETGGTIHSFVWSGRNDHRVRKNAGLELRELLKEIVSDGGRIYVLAHSHGGNVALFALDDPDLRDRIEGIVFMATPFLHFRPQQLKLGFIHVALEGLAALTFGIPMLLLALYGKEFFEWVSPSRTTTGWALGTGLSFILGYILYRFLSDVFESWSPEELARQKSDEYQPRLPGEQTQVLVVRSIRDEATIALVAGSSVELLLAWLWRASAAIFYPLGLIAEWIFDRVVNSKPNNLKLGIAILVVMIGVVLWVAPFGLWMAVVVCFGVAVAIGAFQLLLGMMILILNFVRFGWYGLWSTALVQVSTEATPTGRWNVELFQSEDATLAHSEAYQNSKVVQKITEWIKVTLANQSS